MSEKNVRTCVLYVCLLIKFVRVALVKNVPLVKAPVAHFRLLTRLREHARVPAGQSRVVLISIRRLSILCLISTTLVRISTKCLPVWFYYCEARSSFRMETMKKLCVPVQGCEDVEEGFDVNVGACRWVGSNHENKIGLKRGFPSSVGDLRVSKSKPIAKYCPDVMRLGGNFWVPDSRMPGKKFSSFVHPIPMGVGRHKQGVHAGTPSTDAGSGLQKYWYQVLSARRMKHEKLEDKLNNLR